VTFILRRLIRSAACAVAFAAALAASGAFAAAIGYSVRSDVDRKLYRVDMATGVATAIGATNFSKIEALAINAAGDIYGVNPATAQLVKCSSTTGACTAVGLLVGLPQVQANAGLTFTTNGTMYLAANAVVYRVDPATAAATPLGGTGPALSGLAGVTPTATCASGLFGIGGNTDRGKLYCINVTTGVATLLGALSLNPLDSGLDGDPVTGIVWGISNDDPGQVFAINPLSLAVTNLNTVTLAGVPIGGFESLAIQHTADLLSSEPVPTLSQTALWLLALLMFTATIYSQRRKLAVVSPRK
jgi:IPTL-CTERM motif